MSLASIAGVSVFKIDRPGSVGYQRPVFEDITPDGVVGDALRFKVIKGQPCQLRSMELLTAFDSPWDVLRYWTQGIGGVYEFVDVNGWSIGNFFIHNVKQVRNGVVGPNTGSGVVSYTVHEWDLLSIP